MSDDRQIGLHDSQLWDFLELVPLTLVVADTDGIIRAASRKIEEQFGYARDELLGQNISILTGAQHAPRHDGYIRRYLETGEKRIIGNPRVENARHKNGHAIAVEINIGETEIGDERYFLGFLRVLEQQVSNRQQVQSLLAELAHVSRVSAMGALATAIAHELNQPLTIISNFTEGARDMLRQRGEDPDNAEIIAVLDQCSQQARRAGQLLHRLREFVMSAEPRTQSVSVEELVDDSISLALINGYRRTTTIQREIPEDLPPVNLDKLQGEQVLFNLIRNAFQAMETQDDEHHQVLISACRAPGGYIEIAVEDSGPGIDPAIRQSLFRSFVTTKPGGMGIGLSICRQIVEAHGGRLSVEDSARLGGARFVILLPEAAGDEEHAGQELAAGK